MEGFAKRRGNSLQDLGHLFRQTAIIKDDSRSRLGIFHVEERFVAHPVRQPEPFRDLLQHRVEGMALALPALTGHGDVEAVRVQDGAGGERHDHALGHYLIALVVQGKRPEHRLLRVPVLQGGQRFRPAGRVVEGEGWSGPGPIWCGPRGCSPFLSRLKPFPEFLPPLGPATAGCMLAAGMDGTARELDSERPVPVRTGERAGIEDVERPAPVGLLPGYPDPVAPEPAGELDRLPLPPGPCWGRIRNGCRQRCCQPLKELLSHDPGFLRDR